jgi:hypothetical protein
MPAADLQYPIGPFQFGLPYLIEERSLYLSQVAQAPAKLREAVATVLFFESLAPQDWRRRFFHPERGVLTIQDILPAFAWHARHHTAHITALRDRKGWAVHPAGRP